jgi:ATP-binding cassette subfamily C protein CydC
MFSEGRLSGIYYAMLPLAIMASFEALIPMPNILYRFSEANNAGKNSILSECHS